MPVAGLLVGIERMHHGMKHGGQRPNTEKLYLVLMSSRLVNYILFLRLGHLGTGLSRGIREWPCRTERRFCSAADKEQREQIRQALKLFASTHSPVVWVLGQ